MGNPKLANERKEMKESLEIQENRVTEADVRAALERQNRVSKEEARRIIYAKQKFLRKTNRNFPVDSMVNIPEDDWPKDIPWISADVRTAVLRSRDFFVQIFQTTDPKVLRLSVNRTEIDKNGRFVDGITWEELMAVKTMAGCSEKWAVEVFPPVEETINVANMRHLFLFDEAPSYAWRKAR